jgi:multidrug efflux pump subunit AcrB
MMAHLLGSEVKLYQEGGHAQGKGLIWSCHRLFNTLFEKLRYRYIGLLDWSLNHRPLVLGSFLAITVASFALATLVGEDFFPNVVSGQMRLHARAPAGTRIEDTELRFAALEDEIRKVIPADQIDTLIDNIGIPNSWPAIAQGDIPTISSADGEIQISLNKEKHGPTRDYEVALRKHLREKFPDMTFFFQPANITNQILNFGIPAPIDLQIVGRNADANYIIAERLASKIGRIPGAADVHVHQVVAQPGIDLDVDRVKASQLGLTQRDVTNNMLISLSGSGTVAPNFWINWNNGVNYNVGVQTPQYRLTSLDALLRTPISLATNTVNSATPFSNASVGAAPNGDSQAYGNPGAMAGSTQLLSNLVTVKRDYTPVIVNHYNVWPVFDVYANVDRRDLGGVGSEVKKVMQEEQKHLPRGTTFELRGQIATMYSSFFRLGLGMIFAIMLVYLLMTVNFQSWLDPFIILTALPGAMAGVLWMLFITRTTLSVPSLMGAIMCVGVATANSILIVTFANGERDVVATAHQAMLAAGYARVRPVLMTATAMILGMLPMALGLGEGGEQNAPLGRAVIGGLMFATVTTLFVVPIIYSYLRTKPPVDHEERLQRQELEIA